MFVSRQAYDTQNIDNLHIDIYDMEKVSLDKDWRADGICSPYTRIYMITGGSGTLTFADRSIALLPNNIYIVPAGLSFAYRCDTHLEKIYLHISMTLPGTHDIFTGIGDVIVMEHKDDIISSFAENLKSDTVIKTARIKSLLYTIVSDALQKEKDFAINNYSPVVLNTIKYINNNLSYDLSAKSVADALFISIYQLRKIFKSEIGVPIGQYISERIMHEAEMQVRFTDRSIKEISDSLGFCDQFYFSRCFVAKYGTSPQKYRKLLVF